MATKIIDTNVAFLCAGDFLIGSRRWVVYASPALGYNATGNQRQVTVRSISGNEKSFSWGRRTTMQVERHVEEGTR